MATCHERARAVSSHRIAAGGTGGHFFPAEALAAELVARGRRVALMTDARSGGLHSPVFAGGEQFVISGAGIAGRGVVRAGTAIAGARGRRGAGTANPGAQQCRRGGRFRRLSVRRTGAGHAPDAASPGRDPARAERRARPRQPLPRAPRRCAGTELRRHRSVCPNRRRRWSPAIRCAPRSPRLPRAVHAARGYATSAGARRLARRARVQRRCAARFGRTARRHCVHGCRSCSNAAARTLHGFALLTSRPASG